MSAAHDWDRIFKDWTQAAGGFEHGGYTGSGAGRRNRKTPELEALCGGFTSAMSALGWRLQTQADGRGGINFEWRQGSNGVRGYTACTNGKQAFAAVCQALARFSGLTAFENSFSQLLK